jgi:hypothetical protein
MTQTARLSGRRVMPELLRPNLPLKTPFALAERLPKSQCGT